MSLCFLNFLFSSGFSLLKTETSSLSLVLPPEERWLQASGTCFQDNEKKNYWEDLSLHLIKQNWFPNIFICPCCNTSYRIWRRNQFSDFLKWLFWEWHPQIIFFLFFFFFFFFFFFSFLLMICSKYRNSESGED